LKKWLSLLSPSGGAALDLGRIVLGCFSHLINIPIGDRGAATEGPEKESTPKAFSTVPPRSFGPGVIPGNYLRRCVVR